jgi:hypothetical protein
MLPLRPETYRFNLMGSFKVGNGQYAKVLIVEPSSTTVAISLAGYGALKKISNIASVRGVCLKSTTTWLDSAVYRSEVLPPGHTTSSPRSGERRGKRTQFAAQDLPGGPLR